MLEGIGYNFVICDDTDMVKTEGIPIPAAMSTVVGYILLRDNPATANRQISFEVVLCSTERYDSTNVIGGFQSHNLTISVNNVEPTIRRMEINEIDADGDGYTLPNKMPADQEQTFTLYVCDPSAIDLANTILPFKVRWTATFDGGIYAYSKVIEGIPWENPFKYAFPTSGEWSIKAEVMDKDMEYWFEQTYSVSITVEQPQGAMVAINGASVAFKSASDGKTRTATVEAGTTAGDAVVVPKQTGAQGFYKVWVSDAPIEAE